MLSCQWGKFVQIVWHSKATCIQPKQTTPLPPLPPEQTFIQPQICAGCPVSSCCQSYLTCPLAGPRVNSQQEDFQAMYRYLLWETLFKLTLRRTVVSKGWLTQSLQSVLFYRFKDEDKCHYMGEWKIHQNRFGHGKTPKLRGHTAHDKHKMINNLVLHHIKNIFYKQFKLEFPPKCVEWSWKLCPCIPYISLNADDMTAAQQ